MKMNLTLPRRRVIFSFKKQYDPKIIQINVFILSCRSVSLPDGVYYRYKNQRRFIYEHG